MRRIQLADQKHPFIRDRSLFRGPFALPGPWFSGRVTATAGPRIGKGNMPGGPPIGAGNNLAGRGIPFDGEVAKQKRGIKR